MSKMIRLYELNEIRRTIQGEGYWTGWPCTLVRFQGCNLACSFCDTKQAIGIEGGSTVGLEELIEKIRSIHKSGQMILLTGGEPLIQDLRPLVKRLWGQGTVHLETNGTLPVTGTYDWVTVSPKNGNAVAGAVRRANEIKWLVQTKENVHKLRAFLQGWQITRHQCYVSVQPVSLDEQATQIAFDAAKEYGWQLSLQTHKMIGVK